MAKKNERKRKIDTWAAEKETACLNIAARERERGDVICNKIFMNR